MKKAIVFLSFVLIMSLAVRAQASLEFNLDFGQDGTYDYTDLKNPWRLENVGDVVWIDLYVSKVPNPGLLSMGLDLVYDQAQLAVLGAKIDSPTNWWFGSANTSVPGEVEMRGMRVVGLPGDNIKLGTIELKCIAPGLSELWLYDSDRGGSYDDFVLADSTVLDEQISKGIMVGAVNNVPIPGSLLLLSSALLGLVGLKRRSKGQEA